MLPALFAKCFFFLSTVIACSILENTDTASKYYDKKAVKHPAQCCAICQNDAHCSFAQHFEGNCYLKHLETGNPKTVFKRNSMFFGVRSHLPNTAPRPSTSPYTVELRSHARFPVLSSGNEKGKGYSDCLVFNPSVVLPNPPYFNRSGLYIRECCGKECFGHGRQLRRLREPMGERITYTDCDLLAAECNDPDPNELFSIPGAEDPRAIFNPHDGYQYLFYYGSNKNLPCKDIYPLNATTSDQCTVQFVRTRTPLDFASFEMIASLPWHRNGCCVVRPVGAKSFCMWGEGPGPFPGLGISYTTNFSSGVFHQITWDNTSSSTPSPISPDGLWMLPLGEDKFEIKLEAGTHMHELSTGDLVTFYAAATPGWVEHGNYTVGWLILDGKNPARILERSTSHILVPTYDYETLCSGGPAGQTCRYKGERHNVIFACSAMPTGKKDEFRLYFGGGDGNVGTAVVQIEKLESM